MKNVFLNLLFLIPILSIGQTNYNELTNAEYNDIEIHNVRLEDIKSFQGNAADISQLFGLTFTNTSTDTEKEAKCYENSDLSISYLGYSPDMDLTGIEVKTSNITMTINGMNVSIGDNISVLNMGTNLNSFPIEGDTRLAIFKPYYESSSIGIKYDATFHVITKIYYLSPT